MGLKRIETPLTADAVQSLKIGDRVLLSGTIYTARDQAHKRMAAAIENGKGLPFDITNAVVYYCGPAPARPGRVIGSCGPTTSSRMDAFSPALLKAGLRGMIGKGERGPEVVRAIKRYAGIYFAAVGGAGAYLAQQVTSARVIAYEDLGAEAVRRLVVRDFPLIVAIDAQGRNIFER